VVHTDEVDTYKDVDVDEEVVVDDRGYHEEVDVDEEVVVGDHGGHEAVVVVVVGDHGGHEAAVVVVVVGDHGGHEAVVDVAVGDHEGHEEEGMYRHHRHQHIEAEWHIVDHQDVAAFPFVAVLDSTQVPWHLAALVFSHFACAVAAFGVCYRQI
jgi:hypothetical protein